MEVKTSTLNEHIERHGQLISGHLQQKAEQTLQQYSINAQNGCIEDPGLIADSVKFPKCTEGKPLALCAQEPFKEQIEAFNEKRQPCDQIKDHALIEAVETCPQTCVYVSIDDVGVDHQKDARKDGGQKQGKRVENTVNPYTNSARMLPDHCHWYEESILSCGGISSF